MMAKLYIFPSIKSRISSSSNPPSFLSFPPVFTRIYGPEKETPGDGDSLYNDMFKNDIFQTKPNKLKTAEPTIVPTPTSDSFVAPAKDVNSFDL